MNKASFAIYLDKIRDLRPINYALFLKSAEMHLLNETQLEKFFTKVKVKGGKYQLSIIDSMAFDNLIQHYSTLHPTTRVEASIAGDSHLKRVSGSLLTLLAHQKLFPQVIMINSKGFYQTPNKLHHHLLIIENLENFLALITQPGYLDRWLDEPWPCDIVYAGGNSICNKLHQQFFCHYDKIRCLLDIDLGGFDIFKSIVSLVPQTTICEFVLSDYYLKKYLQYGKIFTNQKYIDLLSRRYPKQLQLTFDMVKKHKKFAEQEILLWD